MARRPAVRAGTVGGYFFNGCVTVLTLVLVAVVSVMYWLETAPERNEEKARENLHEHAETRRQELAAEAQGADGLPDAALTRLFPRAKPAEGLVAVRREGDAVTVTAELLGQGPSTTFIFVNETLVTGCFAFRIEGVGGRGTPRASVRQLADAACTPAATAGGTKGTAGSMKATAGSSRGGRDRPLSAAARVI
ncbi:hypothetical protein ACGFMM_22550 [Streptomyces sp. NPDC048604]|uniref:hypothetical protein n=1 Tax=Streptomyces sp. NPDC048604 TaxID=3365578 RepID=UPI00371C3CD9